MEIIRESILGMLGKDSRRYHTCIATTFAFDFDFFEMRVMRALKGAGIRNILVLVDENSLEEQLENPTGYEFRRNGRFGLYPMTARGVFHPKMVFCVGKNEGFLAIGTGNLTNGGHGSNDELWSVFHYKGEESSNGFIFKQAWGYLGTLSENIEGNSAEKIAWMHHYAPWLDILPKIRIGEFGELEDESISLWPITEGDHGLDKICSLLSEERIEFVTILSPYYDLEGTVLLELSRKFPHAQIKAVIDTEHGLLPYKCPETSISFYDWQKVKPLEGKGISRLHAKLISFRTLSGDEWIITGSSNATCAGLGVFTKKAINKELNLLIRRSNSDVFRALGISIKEEARLDFSSIKRPQGASEPTVEGVKNKPLKIKYAEKEGRIVNIKTEGSADVEIYLLFLDRFGGELSRVGLTEFESIISITLTREQESVFMVTWVDLEGRQLSNKAIVQDTDIHQKCNPNPDLERIESIFREIEDGNLGQIESLLQYVDFYSEGSSGEKKKIDRGALSHKKEIMSLNNTKVDSYEEFTRVSSESLMKQKGLVTAPLVQIAEFLTAIAKRQMALSVTSIQSFDQMDRNDDYEGDEEEVMFLNKKEKSFEKSLRERRAVHGFLKRYHNYLKERTKPIVESKTRGDIEVGKIGVTDYSNFLIAMQLVKTYTGKPFESEERKNGENEYYFGFTKGRAHENLKSFVLEVIGGFLLLGCQDEEEYELESLKYKFHKFKKEAFFNIVFITCNTFRLENELRWMKTILSNSMLMFLLNEDVDSSLFLRELEEWIKETQRQDFFVSSQFGNNFEQFRSNIFPEISEFSKQVKDRSWQLKKSILLQAGEYVYATKLGVMLTKSIKNGNSNPQRKLLLSKPGFKWREREKDYLREEEFVSNIIVPLS